MWPGVKKMQGGRDLSEAAPYFVNAVDKVLRVGHLVARAENCDELAWAVRVRTACILLYDLLADC